jgi:dipeptidyl aminopeptidase/acylaminoacyl peptidase
MDFQSARSRDTAVRRLAAAVLFLCLPLMAVSQTVPTTQSPAARATDARIASLLDDLARVRTPSSVSISPDGNTLAWAFNGSDGSELHLTPIASAGSTPSNSGGRILSPDTIRNVSNSTPGACAASHPAWSPDGKQLAFLSGCSSSNGNWQSDSQDNIFVWTPATNELKQVSHLHGAISSLEWSPDGKSIAFLYVENATRHAGALDAMKPWNGVYGEDGIEVQRVAAIELASSAFRFVSPANLHAYEFSWSPNSGQVVMVAAPPPAKTIGGSHDSMSRASEAVQSRTNGSESPSVELNPDAAMGRVLVIRLRFLTRPEFPAPSTASR